MRGDLYMVVKQVAFEIPDVIQKGIDNGTLFRFGGTVRNAAGHIVKHLDEVLVPIEERKVASKNLMEFVKKNKNIFIGLGVIFVVAVATGITYVVVKNKKGEEIKIPKCVADFNEAFMSYIDSIKKENVSKDKIEKVIVALDNIKKEQIEGNIDIEFLIENASLLIDMIKNYTEKLAEGNSFEITDYEPQNAEEIICLQHYLNIQKQVFDQCA